ncbi:MAG: hypothetical protein NTX49_00685 [Chlamydiae bacterium]|nr:hypothetical protein [Chlamydiota bacterium]
MGKRAVTFVHNITNLAYILVSIILFAIAFIIIFWSVWQIGLDFFHGNSSEKGELLYKVMDEVAFIIFSIAVADVAKYLMVEEVLHGKEKKPAAERRRALSNLILIISTAFSLEGLILTIQVAKTKMENLVYPIMLLVVSAILLVALGLYQKLTSPSKEAV